MNACESANDIEDAKRKLTITCHIFLFFFGLVLVDVNIDPGVLGYRGFGILISHDVILRCGWLAFCLVYVDLFDL
jgi:hypothetical protein